MKEMFRTMDVNNNGKITLEELKHGLHKMGYQLPDADVKILMDAVSISPVILTSERESLQISCEDMHI